MKRSESTSTRKKLRSLAQRFKWLAIAFGSITVVIAFMNVFQIGKRTIDAQSSAALGISCLALSFALKGHAQRKINLQS
ncbi:hypothetical protein ACE1TF_15200 [Geomicrobium sp. JSM 1781026]|uniref:hypothetical protein n=1 Tax=Geomicrobium sp. JSM 1781026 TaxID=3344580 RepID=UPI0035C23330